ncbi:MAG: hypothetical protein OXG70_04340 [Cyanobacteria bacterium MAG IRC1_bin_28]|nr:hypothetical protein [Cyanobacteria bacterium MAG IRC1_bin_28]
MDTGQEPFANFGKHLDATIGQHNSLDADLRRMVVTWDGVRLVHERFEGQGLHGDFVATCLSGNHLTCVGHDDSAAAIRPHQPPVLVGVYGAAKCNGGTCPGFDLPDVAPPIADYQAWGPWDDLPLTTQQDIAAVPDPQSLGWKDNTSIVWEGGIPGTPPYKTSHRPWPAAPPNVWDVTAERN